MVFNKERAKKYEIAQTNCMYPFSPSGTSVTELKGLKLHCYSWKSEKLPERQWKA